MAITTQGFDFGRGLLGEAQQFSALEQQQQQLQQQRFAQQQIEQQIQRQEQIRQLLGQAAQPQEAIPPEMAVGGAAVPAEEIPEIPTQQELIAEAQQIDPGEAQRQLKAMGLDDPSRRAEASRTASQLMSIPFEQRESAIMERANTLRSQGRDPSDTMQLLEMNEAQQNQALTGIQLLDLSTKERFAIRERERAARIPKAVAVKSSDILPDGTTIQVMGDGSTRVTSPEGAELTGAARSQAIRSAQEFGVDIQQRRAQARGIGKFTSKKAEQVTERAEKLRENNVSLRQVIGEIKAGAETGPLISKLPSIRASSVRLENLKRQLGLDVIGSVTFGALSESELKMALDTALPTGLAGPELVRWAEDKIDAQEKLAAYLEDQSSHLMRPGNTPETWQNEVNQRKRERDLTEREAALAQPTAPAAQQVLRFNPATGRLE